MRSAFCTTLLLSSLYLCLSSASCPGYSGYSQQQHEPLSTGSHQLSYMRPSPECRTFNSTGVEKAINQLKDVISDPDLFRLFENTFPNTLDTAIKWRGTASNNSDEELTFVITGDIDAMWIRDSANQIAPYKAVLKNETDDIASVFRGTLNLQARYLIQYPYCNAFQPPDEAETIHAVANAGRYIVHPPYDKNIVFTCNFELDVCISEPSHVLGNSRNTCHSDQRRIRLKANVNRTGVASSSSATIIMTKQKT
jgi:uncharacterized protein